MTCSGTSRSANMSCASAAARPVMSRARSESRTPCVVGCELQSTTIRTRSVSSRLNRWRCLGCCTLAPVVRVDETTFGHVTVEKVPGLIRDVLAQGEAEENAEHGTEVVGLAVEGDRHHSCWPGLLLHGQRQ